jgi:predicted metalloprotease with PDZ domain
MLIAAILSALVSAPTIDASYVVTVTGAREKRVSVEALFICDLPQTLSLTIGAGSRHPFQYFGDFVEDVRAKVDFGEQIEPERTSPDTWSLPNGQHFQVTYKVRMDHLSKLERQSVANTPYMGPDFLTFPTIGIFLRPGEKGGGGTALRYLDMQFRLPTGWRVATNFDELEAGRYCLSDPARFAQYSFIALGKFDSYRVKVGNTDVRIITCGHTYEFKVSRFREVAAKAVRAVHDFYGGLPETRLLLIAAPMPGSRKTSSTSLGGTVSRSAGMSMMLSIDEKMTEKELNSDIAILILHETFHLGNPRCTEQDVWFHEGFTTYYSLVLAARHGFITQRDFCRRLAEYELNDRRSPRVSLLEAGERMFEDPSCFRDVYAGGALLAFLLDVEMRRLGTATLDEVVRELFCAYTLLDEPYTLKKLVAVAKTTTRIDLQRFIDRYVTGTQWPNVSMLLYELGQSVEVTARDYSLGVRVDERVSGGVKVVSVEKGGPAARAGLRVGDVISTVDGRSTRTERSFADALSKGPKGDGFKVEFCRGSAERELTVVPRIRKTVRVEPISGGAYERDILSSITTPSP